MWAGEWPASNSDGHSLDVVGNFIGWNCSFPGNLHRGWWRRRKKRKKLASNALYAPDDSLSLSSQIGSQAPKMDAWLEFLALNSPWRWGSFPWAGCHFSPFNCSAPADMKLTLLFSWGSKPFPQKAKLLSPVGQWEMVLPISFWWGILEKDALLCSMSLSSRCF